MLKLLRKKAIAKKVLWGLAVIIVPAFVLWGAGGSKSSRHEGLPSYVGEIYGKKISLEKFAESCEVVNHHFILTYGGDAEKLKEMRESADMNDIAWRRLVQIEEAKRRRIRISDKEVIDEVTSNASFQRDGVFDEQIYHYLLKNYLRTTPREYEEEVRGNETITKLRQSEAEKVGLDEGTVLKEYMTRNEKAEMSYVLIENDAFAKDVKIAEEELKAFYEGSAESFRGGDEVSIRYMRIEEDKPDLMHKVSEGINNEKDFEKIAEENELNIEETPFFGKNEEIPGIGWSREVAQAAFDLKKGMTSPPIHTSKTLYVINIKGKRTGYMPSFEEVRSLIDKKLRDKKSSELAKASASSSYNKIKEALEKESGLEEAAKKLKLELKKSKPFMRQGYYIEGIGQAESLKEAVFAASKGEINPPVEYEKGFVIFALDEITAADETKFDEQKEGIETELLNKKKKEYLDEWFEDLCAKHTKLLIDLEVLR